jgi:hypothetical protein
MGIRARAWWAGLTAVSHQRDLVIPVITEAEEQSTTHVRKGEALRHHGGLTCEDREPMLVRRSLSFVAWVHLRWVSGCWRNGADRPVLKHGPRSLILVQVDDF